MRAQGVHIARWLTVVAVVMAAVAPAMSAAPLKRLQVGFGYFPFGPLQRSFVHYDEKFHAVRAEARELGYDLTVRWIMFPTAPEELVAFKTRTIVIGPMATAPLIAQIKKGERFVVVSNTLGMYQFLVMVRKRGNIKSFDDLAGKTVGVAIGTAHHSAFESFLLAEFDKSSQEMGIRYVNQPVPLPMMPRGLDAYITFIPAILRALENPNSDIEPLLTLSAPAATGSAYDGPLGKGAGVRIPSARRSPFYPEGFIALRTPFVVTEEFLRQHPDVVKAFVTAQQKVTRMLRSWPPSKITDLWPESAWQVIPRKAFEEKSLATDLLYKHRDWVWPTKAISDIMWVESEQMVKAKITDSPLTQAELQGAFAPIAPILRATYQKLGNYPSINVFTDPKAEDFRGVPIWFVDWRAYKR